jgi:hypothetical protein
MSESGAKSSEVVIPHRAAEYEDGYVWFFCRGCETHHRIKKGPWTYNGDPVRPTIDLPLLDDEASPKRVS